MFQPASDFTMHAARPVFEAGLAAIAGGQESINLAQLKMIDSSAIAAMLAWQRAASVAGRSLRLLNAPENLLILARLYGLDTLLPFQHDSQGDSQDDPQDHPRDHSQHHPQA